MIFHVVKKLCCQTKAVKVSQAVAKKCYMKGKEKGNRRELGGQWNVQCEEFCDFHSWFNFSWDLYPKRLKIYPQSGRSLKKIKVFR